MNNVLSTRVTIFRNIKDFKFVPKLEVEQKQQILDIVEKAVHGKMALVNVANLDGEVSKNLIANDLLFANTQDLFLSKENLTISCVALILAQAMKLLFVFVLHLVFLKI